ncbi:ArdC-like ssDNA-binding domain-containing protein, partial [Candidatus Poribacteria bacterium]
MNGANETVEISETRNSKAKQFMLEVVQHLRNLAKETDEVKKSEFFKQYLETMSKFWRYSYHNQLLIVHQMPRATRVAGFRKWREMGRWVRKGCKAIRILAPRFRKELVYDEEAKRFVEKEEVVYFVPVPVFDLSQTEGQPLPEVEISIEGDNYKGFLDNLMAFCESKKIKVNFKNLGINGLYGYSKGGQIAITNTESINTQVNTMIHEVAHELLHRGRALSKQRTEIQAEGVAYVVTRHYGCFRQVKNTEFGGLKVQA